MCWSGEASFTLATIGFTGAYYAARHKEPVGRWLPLVYFSLMETLQGFTYGWIGQCGNTWNENLTVLSYLHIVFQPFMVNLFGTSFLPPERQRKVWWIWIVSGLASMVMLSMYLFPQWPGHCLSHFQSLCGTETCSYHGNWHIAWMLNLSSLDRYWTSYMLACFIAPLFYGGWRFVLYHIVCGPMLAFMLSSNKDEQPAIWCLLSIAFLVATHVPVVKRWLTCKQTN
jgi:hypothetical protein